MNRKVGGGRGGRASAALLLAVTVALGAVLLPAIRTAHAAEQSWWSENFEHGDADFVDPFKHDPRLLGRVYSVDRDGDNHVLHALHDETRGAIPAMHFGKAFTTSPPPLDRVRALRWRWRILRHPSVGNDPWADVAASVYVVVKTPSMLHGGRGFKLGWLAKHGSEDTYQHGLLQVPLEVGGPLGEWRSESVDLCALYRRDFGSCEGEHVLYVGVVTDADQTHSIAEAEYDDFELAATP